MKIQTISLVIATVLVSLAGYAQTPILGSSSTTITAQGHRPLADALDQLQTRISKPINFEEAPYQDSRDVGMQPIQAMSGTINFLYPLGGRFSADLKQGDTDAGSTAKTVLNAYHSAGLAGIYTTVERGGRVDVVPSQVRSPNGSASPVAPLMEHRISFAKAVRPLADTIQMVVETLATARGVKIVIASMPVARRASIELGADNEPASDVLLAAFARLSPASVYYRLLYDPNDRTYYLTVRGTPQYLGEPGPSPAAQKPIPVPSPPDSPFFQKAN